MAVQSLPRLSSVWKGTARLPRRFSVSHAPHSIEEKPAIISPVEYRLALSHSVVSRYSQSWTTEAIKR
jgi:hypothetical protein